MGGGSKETHRGLGIEVAQGGCQLMLAAHRHFDAMLEGSRKERAGGFNLDSGMRFLERNYLDSY